MLKPLLVKTNVRIQVKGRWDRTGRIVEVLPFRQYRVRMDGSGRVTIRNRRFLKPINEEKPRVPLPGPVTLEDDTVSSDTEANQAPTESPLPNLPEHNDSPAHSENTNSDHHNNSDSKDSSAKIPKALRDLATYNKEGLLEGASTLPKSRLRSGRL